MTMPVDFKTQYYRNVILADRIRNQLIEIYGGKCAQCGASKDEVHLEINHIYGRKWKVRTLNRYNRFLRYRKEAREGRINLLCKDCNAVWRPRREETAPGWCPLFEAWENGNRPF